MTKRRPITIYINNIGEMEINNRPSPFVLVKTGSGIFSPAAPPGGAKDPASTSIQTTF